MHSDQVRRQLTSRGFAIIAGVSMDAIEALGAELGQVRSGWEILVPQDADNARENSLSSRYGRNAFPWHSDGAIARRPPRYLLMYSRMTEPVEPTEILSLTEDPRTLQAMARTVLLIKRGSSKRYASALERRSGGFLARWDTRSAPPLRSVNAGIASSLIEESPPTGRVDWRYKAGVVIDNHRCLHRRPAIANSSRTLYRMYAY